MRIAFVSYETPFAPAGGIAAVMGKLPPAMREIGAGEVIVVTPFHHRIPRTASLESSLALAADCAVPYQSRMVRVRVLRGSEGIFFLRPDDPMFFAGSPHPYLVADDATLRRDALFFGVATWRALQALGGDPNWTLLLQDWQAATTALAASQTHRRPRMVLTLHNSYDAGLTDSHLAEFALSPWSCPGITALTRALPLVEPRVPTVSGQFAVDLLTDPLQTQVLADHLGPFLAGRVIGINNGPFSDLQIDLEALARAARGDFAPLLEWKSGNRRLALEALRKFEPGPQTPFWGDRNRVLARASSGIPWFVMAGRDDSRQKGYDVAAEAVRAFLTAGGRACFFFFPIPGDEGLAGLSFLRDLADDFPEYVGGFPFRWTEGFFATLRGASFGLMPSFYEPFGMANEFYLSGTPGIGRATGGIVQQIVPFKGCASFSLAAEEVVNPWHAWSAAPTGLLFRESLDLAAATDGWRRINDASYPRTADSTERVESRRGIPLFRSMVSELVAALSDGCALSADPEAYCGMLVAGVAHIRRAFSWQRAAREYGRLAGLS